jgi:hypothetical protein
MIDRFQCTGPFDESMPHYYVIISDYRWWVDNEKEIAPADRVTIIKNTSNITAVD